MMLVEALGVAIPASGTSSSPVSGSPVSGSPVSGSPRGVVASGMPAPYSPVSEPPSRSGPSPAACQRLVPTLERRILALVLPDLLEELVLQRTLHVRDGQASQPTKGGDGRTAAGTLAGTRARPRPIRREPRAVPRAIVLSDLAISMLEPSQRLDFVNAAARKLGVSTRHTIAQASALVDTLVLHVLPPASVSRALERVAEAALGFGTPVSFRVPDTVWVDITGTHRLFGGERELAAMVAAHVRSLGHTVRVAGASGPWLAQSFARHADFDETGVLSIDTAAAREKSALLPIGALPISGEAVAWFARLGLLTLDDLRKLPRSALAARLEGGGFERTLDLIDGRDDGVLDAHLPEELPFEEQSWDFPLESVEPLLFVLKGLSARLSARLEGRGQAAQELLLTIRYDKSLAALRHREVEARPPDPPRRHLPRNSSSPPAPGPSGQRNPPAVSASAVSASAVNAPAELLEIPFRLASPLAHADDLERIVRTRLQRLTLSAPSIGVRLQVTAITEARQWQQSLDVDAGLSAPLSDAPQTLAVLMAELSADVGEDAVGMLEAHDSHLLEKSSCFVTLHQLTAEGRAPGSSSGSGSLTPGPRYVREPSIPAQGSVEPVPTVAPFDAPSESPCLASVRPPTRLISPIEIKARLKEKEIIVLDQRPFVIEAIRFEERLEAVEWWASAPVSRDYFRLWLTSLTAASFAGAASAISSDRSPAGFPRSGASPPGRARKRSDGLEVLVYLNRVDGKKYVQALYD